MAYTWEEVMLGVDIKAEQTRKAKQQREIEEKATDESTAAGWWKMGLSFLGGAIFGPAGYFLGKQLGEYGTDLAYDWETMEMEEGKFNVAGAKEFNRTLKKAADDQTQGQVLNTILDIGKMYVSAGGLQEGDLDFTTFGSGDAEWSVFGKGTPFSGTTWASEGAGGAIDPTTGKAIGSAVMPTGEGYVPSLWDKDTSLLSNIGKTAGKFSTLYGQDQAVSTIGRFAQDVYETKRDKGIG